ncbi:hypothetical protein [Psychromonas sp. MME2]|uniref:hypothetical protein n=1 Tax=Psychromonas sp. MME2 TaxID=3231033 RepID=UPI00339CA4E0
MPKKRRCKLNFNRKWSTTIASLLVTLCLLIVSNVNAAHVTLTESEKAWIKAHPTITLGSDSSWNRTLSNRPMARLSVSIMIF